MTLRAPVQAPQSAFGFSIQKSRMFYHLLTAENPNTTVSIEVDEDVCVKNHDGKCYLEQVTSSQTGNPISNKSEKPWKTLANWVAGVTNNLYTTQDAKFVLYVLQKNNPGALIKEMDACTNIEEAKTVLEKIRKSFKDNDAEDKKSSLEIILDKKYEKVVLEIIVGFSVQTGNSKYDEEINSAIKNEAYDEARAEQFKIHMLGRISDIVDTLHSQNKSAVISRSDFLQMQKAFNEKYCSVTALAFVLEETFSNSDYEEQIRKAPNYIKQLTILDLEHESLISAAADFLKASVYRAKMAESHEYSEENIKDYEGELIATWNNERMILMSDSTLSDTNFGVRLYGECWKKSKNFAQKTVPDFFTRGNYHFLANAPVESLVIGWHKKFKEILEAL